MLLVSQDTTAILESDVKPAGLQQSVKVSFNVPALQPLATGTIVALKISRQSDTAPFHVESFDVVYATVENDTDTKVAQKIFQLIQGLNVVGITPPGSGKSFTVTPVAGFRRILVECGTFGRKLTETSGLTANVTGNVIEYAGQASDPGGAFVNLNLGGPLGTFGVFVPVAEGDSPATVATNTVAALNALKSSPRISSALSSVTLQQTDARITIGGTEEIECEITKDDRVGHPTNSFCCRHHKCCSDRIGRVVAVAMDLDAALIQLDGEQKYIAKVEDIPENGGACPDI